MRHLLILLSILLLSSLLFGQSSKKVDLSLLAKELMFWMQANCEVPGVHPEHNFCNLNWNHPVPEITILPRKQLVKEFKNNGGNIPDGNYNKIRGFYLNSGIERFTIYMRNDLDYSMAEYQSDLFARISTLETLSITMQICSLPNKYDMSWVIPFKVSPKHQNNY